MAEAFKGKAAKSVMEYANGKFFDYSGNGIDPATKLNNQGYQLMVLLMCYAQGTSPKSSAYKTTERIAAGDHDPTVGDIAAIIQSIEKDNKDPDIARLYELLAEEAYGTK